MNISTREVDTVTVVHFEGNLDTNTAPEAEQRFNDLISGGASKILVDFGALDYISSAGLRVLLATAKKLGINRTTLFNKMRKFDLLDFPTKDNGSEEPPPAA